MRDAAAIRYAASYAMLTGAFSDIEFSPFLLRFALYFAIYAFFDTLCRLLLRYFFAARLRFDAA